MLENLKTGFKIIWDSPTGRQVLIAFGICILVVIALFRINLWGKKGLLSFIPSLRK